METTRPFISRHKLTFWQRVGCFLIGFCPVMLVESIIQEKRNYDDIILLNDIYERQLKGHIVPDEDLAKKEKILILAKDEQRKHDEYLKILTSFKS